MKVLKISVMVFMYIYFIRSIILVFIKQIRNNIRSNIVRITLYILLSIASLLYLYLIIIIIFYIIKYNI